MKSPIKYLLFLFALLLIGASSVQGQNAPDSVLQHYDRYWSLPDQLYRVQLGGMMGIVDREGKMIVPCDFNQVWNLDSDGYFKVLKSGKVGLYHKEGRVVIPAEYDQVWSFEDDWAKVMKNGKIGYFSIEGYPVVPCEYQQIWPFNDGKARVMKAGKVGYIDREGVEVIPCEYQQIWSFEEGRARVLKNGLVGYVDEGGNEVVPPMFSHIWSFEEGRAKALLDGSIVWIDESGEIIEKVDAPEIVEEKDEMEEVQEEPEQSRDIIIENRYGGKTHVKILGGEVVVVEEGPNTRIEIGKAREKYNKAEKNRRFKGHFTGFEFGFSNYLGSTGSTNLPADADFMSLNHGQSTGMAFNFIQYSIGLQRRGNIGLVTGLGVEHNRYHLAGPYLLTKNDAGNTDYVTSDRKINKNYLATTYMNMPLLFEFQIPTNRHSHPLYFSAGAVGGWRLNSFTRTKYGDNEGPHKERTNSNFNLQNWRYGAMARLGYRAVNLYATYYVSPFFKEGKGPELNGLNVGASIFFDVWDLGN